MRKYDAADFPNTPSVNRVGVASTQGTIPEWRATAGLAWNRDAFGLGGTVRYVSSYKDVNTSNVVTGRNVGSQTIFDLQGSLDLYRLSGRSWFRGLTVRVGVLNLFDREAPFSEVSTSGYDPSLGDLRQRFVYGALTKTF